MPAEYGTIQAKVEQGIVQRSGSHRTFGDSYRSHNVMFATGSRDNVRFRTRHRDSLLNKTPLKGGERLHAGTGRAWRDAPYPVRVARNARFREDNQPRPRSGGLTYTFSNPPRAGLRIIIDGSKLCRRDNAHNLYLPEHLVSVKLWAFHSNDTRANCRDAKGQAALQIRRSLAAIE